MGSWPLTYFYRLDYIKSAARSFHKRMRQFLHITFYSLEPETIQLVCSGLESTVDWLLTEAPNLKQWK